MEKRQLRRMTFSDMRELVSRDKSNDSQTFYIAKDFALGRHFNNIFRSIMLSDVPILIEDPRVGIIKKGEVHATINLIDYHITPNTIAYIGRGSIVQLHSASEDLDIEGMVFQDDFLNISLHGKLPLSINGQERNFYVSVTNEETERIESIYDAIWKIVQDGDYCDETVYGLTSALVHQYDFIRSRHSVNGTQKRSREDEVFDRFISLVNENKGCERSTKFYADRIFLTERYMGTVIKQVSGITAKEWIDRAAITNAKVLLRHSNLQISQIADKMNFPNDSFFCKYFKRLTGKTPKEYKNMNNLGDGERIVGNQL